MRSKLGVTPVNELKYPALFESADESAASSQTAFFAVLVAELGLLVASALLSLADYASPYWAILQAVVLLAALGCTIYIYAAKPDRRWYASRAIAESIKTVTWRYVSKAEPFDCVDMEARGRFTATLKSIVEQNRDVAQQFSGQLGGRQITAEMDRARSSNLDERIATYLTGRVEEQHRWYARESKKNRQRANQFFVALIAINSIAVLLAITKIAFPENPYWPTEVVVTLAAVVLTWIQARRFSQLASSYALAAHEISLIREQAEGLTSEEDFSKFVGDAENAFSREHTQWVARKDE